MLSAVGWPGGDMLGDLSVFGAVSGNHQHDTIYRNGFGGTVQQLIGVLLRLALGNGNPISQGLEHALRFRIMRLVMAGDVMMRTQSFNPGYADSFCLTIRIFRAMVGMQTMR